MSTIALPALGNERRQPVLDAVVELQGRRRTAVAAIEAGRPRTGARIVAAGPELGAWMMREAFKWRHLLSTRPSTCGAELSVSIVNNRRLLDGGLQMVSVFDREGTDAAARSLLEADPSGVYFYGYSPVQMRLVDRREVLLHGPQRSGGGTILGLTDQGALAAARAYWRAVTDTVVRCNAIAPRIENLTARQQRVLELLRQDIADGRIAIALGVSVRTVRYEIAAVTEFFGVRSRFAAGYAYAEARRPALLT